MSAKFWSNVGVTIQSLLGAAQAISGITKAAPPVLTYAGADPANGDFILLDVQGMQQLDDRVARVANVNTGSNTLELEDLDSTLFDTFSSGNLYPVTFGTTLTSATGINVTGGDPEFADITTIHTNQRRQVPVVVTPLVITFDCLFDPADTALAALKVAADALTTRAVKLTFADGTVVVFNGYISASLFPTGQAQQVVKTPVTITAAGAPCVYAP
jgi:hypothetical protein